MLREQFAGRNPSHFTVNPIVKSFIYSEIFIWSAWNLITPIFAIFAATQITGGGIEIAGSSYSTHLIARIISELISGRYLTRSTEKKKFIFSIIGIVIISLAFLGFAAASFSWQLYVYYAISGIGIGIATPAKNSLFSTHLDKNKESTEWSLYDALTFSGTALASTAGGFIAMVYGFDKLFLIAALINILGIIPYTLILVYPIETK